ncbi:MAG: SpoIIE family protein phosphatase [Leptospiraceae bacterium]|nr:SpoIIE family protein phosphatase [Leptospiraceae bacterium]
MKKIIFIISMLWTSVLFASDKIDLVKNCETSDSCKSHIWSITNHFKEKYVDLGEFPQDWKKIESFPVYPNTYFPTDSNFGEYTLYTNFILPEEFLDKNKGIGLQLAGIGEAYSVYINGDLLFKEGRVEDNKVVFNRYSYQSVWEIKDRFLKPGLNHLVIRIQGNPHFSTSLFDSDGYAIGYYDDLVYEERDRMGEMLTFLYFFVGLYHLLLYFKRKKEKYNLYFALFTVFLFFYYIPRHGYLYEYGFDSVLGFRFELISLFLSMCNFPLFLGSLLINKTSQMSKVYLVFSYFLVFTCMFISEAFIMYILYSWQIATIVFVTPYSGYIFYKSIKEKNKDAYRLLIGTILLVCASFFDIANSVYPMINIMFVQYALFGFIIGIAGILASRFLNLYQTVETLNQDLNEFNAKLEEKVKIRTKELQKSLNEIKLLKEKQDGDYFLTTLIFKPLALNLVESENIKVDFLIHQKKKFEFRKKIHEIGGDICIANSIQLKSKNYTVFINGDAMGKSIQGAGGAIVLGVVFNSVIARTKLIKENIDSTPEEWLKISFIELQNIFESFDGSMMISVVLGLVENDTGMMYFINAEHPWTTLYRDKKASFIEDELMLHKIGMIGLTGSLAIRTFQLQDNDVIFIGSDGRDDIDLSKEESETRKINEDETLFLKHVEKGQGDLIQVFESIEESGELTDDCSLLRIEYKDLRKKKEVPKEFTKNYIQGKQLYKKEKYKEALIHFQECYSLYPYHENLIKFLGNAFFRNGDYQEAAHYYQIYTDQFPWDEKGLLQASVCYKFIKEYNKAAQIGEKLKLREPKNSKYLINLIEIYISLENFTRANKLFQDAMEIDPKNPELIAIQNELNFSSSA